MMLRKLRVTLTGALLTAVAVVPAVAQDLDPFLSWPPDTPTGWEPGWEVPAGTVPPPAGSPEFSLGSPATHGFSIHIDNQVPGTTHYEYRMERGSYPQGGAARFNATTFTRVMGVQPGSTYYVQVRACNTGGCGTWSEISPGSVIETELDRDGSIAAPWFRGVIWGDWEIATYAWVKGADAWKALQKYNQFNEPARDGFEYYLILTEVKYNGSGQGSMITFRFVGITPEGRILDPCRVVVPDDLKYETLIPGSSKEGFICLEGPAHTKFNLLIQDTSYGGDYTIIELDDNLLAGV